jgi:hypothetical protein
VRHALELVVQVELGRWKWISNWGWRRGGGIAGESGSGESGRGGAQLSGSRALASAESAGRPNPCPPPHSRQPNQQPPATPT